MYWSGIGCNTPKNEGESLHMVLPHFQGGAKSAPRPVKIPPRERSRSRERAPAPQAPPAPPAPPQGAQGAQGGPGGQGGQGGQGGWEGQNGEWTPGS